MPRSVVLELLILKKKKKHSCKLVGAWREIISVSFHNNTRYVHYIHMHCKTHLSSFTDDSSC